MERIRRELIATPSSPGILLLCEHPPTITCGRHSNDQNVLLSPHELERRGIALERINRGGDVTYHGPGQLMIYPVVRVGVRVTAYMESLAGALATLANDYGVEGAAWEREEAGLWFRGRKLAACGLHLHHGVSIHGFAFNVCTDPSDWNCIVPCGLTGPGPISLHEAIGECAPHPTVEECAHHAWPLLAKALEPFGLDPSVHAALR